MTDKRRDSAPPRPFYDDGFPRATREAVRALWEFHTALTRPHAPALDGSDLEAYFEAEKQKARRGQPLKVVSSEVGDEAYLACSAHDLPLEPLARQVRASRRFVGPIRFAGNREVNHFIEAFAGSHGRLLARLAGATGSWQIRSVNEFSRGFFWVGRLITLKRDVDRDWIFIPESDLEQHDVTVEQLQTGRLDENMRRLLWKQTIRAKDAFAQSEQLVSDLSGRYASAFKRWWFAGLEVLNEIARRDYDVWSEPIELSRYQRAQARFQARFGRTTFRSH